MSTKIMEKKVVAFLSGYFTRLRNFDFANAMSLGKQNIRLLIANLDLPTQLIQERLEDIEEEINGLANTNPFNQLLAAELGAEISFERLKFGNRKYVISKLVNLITKSTDKPILPSLRSQDHFHQSNDVMVYFGENPVYEVQSDRPLGQPNWVTAKILKVGEVEDNDYQVYIFGNNEVTTFGSLENHYFRLPAFSPLIFKRKEFFEIRRILEANTDKDFINAFLTTCEKGTSDFLEPWEDSEFIKQIILDPSVEEITDQELNKRKKELIAQIYQVTKRSDNWANEGWRIAMANFPNIVEK